MAQLSISLDAKTESMLEHEVEQGDFQSKSALVKKAIIVYMQELAYQRILQGQREYAAGKVFILNNSLADHIKKTAV
jgi:Arc/MetJ-type ribon-helix-helix transcriptional regulator